MITVEMNKAEVEAEMAELYPDVKPGTKLYAEVLKLEMRFWVTKNGKDDRYGVGYFVRDDR